jgi:preprotein translocase subunit SecY
MGTLALATFQAFGVAVMLESQLAPGNLPVVIEPGLMFRITTAITLVSGTMFLMWLGEQVTERGIGNGISLIIFAGIVAGLPAAVGGTLELSRTGELSPILVLVLFALALLVTAFVIYVERGQRRITVNYAKRQQGRKMYAAQSSHLPLKVNMAGVIPPIFASSIILFPATLGGWFGSAEGMGWLQDISATLSPGQPLYVAFYALAIIFFCFFYTALMFNPQEVADNLKRSGAFVPGIRPGQQTANYIDGVLTRLTVFGSAYIALVCLMPQFLVVMWNVPFYLGGTSLLIVVVVVMDFMAQVQSHMMSHQYDSVMKKAKLNTYGGSGR